MKKKGQRTEIKKSQMREEKELHHRTKNNYMKILWKIICQQIGQPRRNQ